MNKQVAIELQDFAEVIASRFSQTKRVGNINNETFSVEEVIPISDHSAVINFVKSSGKVAVAFCYYITKGRSKGWKYFFPTDSHVSGFQAFFIYKTQAERRNFSKNF
jgi:hypothetical protein